VLAAPSQAQASGHLSQSLHASCDLTIADPDWSSLIVAPPYPSYADNAATIGATSATILTLFFGRDDINFEAHWEGNPGWTRSYAGFWELAEE